jgi:hypothetical protein
MVQWTICLLPTSVGSCLHPGGATHTLELGLPVSAISLHGVFSFSCIGKYRREGFFPLLSTVLQILNFSTENIVSCYIIYHINRNNRTARGRYIKSYKIFDESIGIAFTVYSLKSRHLKCKRSGYSGLWGFYDLNDFSVARTSTSTITKLNEIGRTLSRIKSRLITARRRNIYLFIEQI